MFFLKSISYAYTIENQKTKSDRYREENDLLK